MENRTVGRESEKKQLNAALTSNEAEFIAIYGRRRVGKTHLIKHFIEETKALSFIVTGLKDGTLEGQLAIFVAAFEKTFKPPFQVLPPNNWLDALKLLNTAIEQIGKTKKIIIFFDELPWLVTQKSGFLQALEHYWNTTWSYQSTIKLIVCGSAASWMLDNLINAKGGLHNRLSRIMQLRPFTLSETAIFLKHRGIRINHKQVLDLYMTMGGVPYYLKAVEKGLSAIQNINNICFSYNGLLFTEFNRLYASLFDHSEAHLEIVKNIAKYRYGINKETLLKRLKCSSSGGTFTKRLRELEEAGFIVGFIPYGYSKKGTCYRIIDEYSAFYLKWIAPVTNQIKLSSGQENYWQKKSQSAAWKSWSGYAFEAVCFKHIYELQKKLAINVGYELGTWQYRSNIKEKKGAQIDLLFDRDDNVINLCEIKYANKPFRITKQYASELADKVDSFQEMTKTRKQIFITMITTQGLLPGIYVDELISNQIILEDFFN